MLSKSFFTYGCYFLGLSGTDSAILESFWMFTLSIKNVGFSIVQGCS